MPITGPVAIGGEVSGLEGRGLILQNNAGDDLPIAANGFFNFSQRLPVGSTYQVTVKQQPASPPQTCVVTPSSASASKDVRDVKVVCTTDSFKVSGTVVGLAGAGLVLQNNEGDDLAVSTAGTFSFPTKVKSGDDFKVTVKTQPSGPTQTCQVSGGTGTIGAADVSSVVVNCSTNDYIVGGTVTGLEFPTLRLRTAVGLVLENNGGDDIQVTANGTFAFPSPLKSGQTYAVTVKVQPSFPAQTCTVSMGSGTVTSANIASVAITCTTNTYKVGGTVNGLAGSGLVLQDNGGDDLPVAADGSFIFPTQVKSGADFNVTVKTQPSGPTQTCQVMGATGTVGNDDVSSVVVNCSTNQYVVGGTLSGLAFAPGFRSWDGLVLQNNGGDDLVVTANGTFAFSTPLDSGQTYNVTVLTQPGFPAQTCTVSMGSGTVTSDNIASVAVDCTTNTYKIGGTVTGLNGGAGGTIPSFADVGLVLQNNGGDDLAIDADGSFTFATPVASGLYYDVTIKNQPSDAVCSVQMGHDYVTNSDVSDVTVSCVPPTYSITLSISGLQPSESVTLAFTLGGMSGISDPLGNGSSTEPSIPAGISYQFSINTQPPSSTCTIANGSGTITADTTVTITCTPNPYTIGGTVSGLVGTGLVLQNNGGDDLPIGADGGFTFGTQVASGMPYNVSVKTQPSGSNCTVQNSNGTVSGANVSNVTVTCTPPMYRFTVEVTGLNPGDWSGVTLGGLGGGYLPLQNGNNWPGNYAGGSTYNLTNLGQPPGGTCTMDQSTGTLTADTVVHVTCTYN